jgi:hypothetical protein
MEKTEQQLRFEAALLEVFPRASLEQLDADDFAVRRALAQEVGK